MGSRQHSQWPSDNHFSGQACNREKRDSSRKIPVLAAAQTDILIVSAVGPKVSAYGGSNCPQVSQDVGQPQVLLMWTQCMGLPNFKSCGTTIPDNI